MSAEPTGLPGRTIAVTTLRNAFADTTPESRDGESLEAAVERLRAENARLRTERNIERIWYRHAVRAERFERQRATRLTGEVRTLKADRHAANDQMAAETERRLAAEEHPLAWARQLGSEQLLDFIDALAVAAGGGPRSPHALTEVERAIVRWRPRAETQAPVAAEGGVS